MPTLVLRKLALILSFTAALATTTLPVDNADPRILYTGSWTKNPISDPENFNYGGSLTATNDTTAKATFTFSGAIQVAVFGSFPFAGTFSMHSEYSIDGAGLTQFEPPTVINHPQYREQFFVSGALSTGQHQLVIANLGRSFYLDYILLTLPSASTLSPTPTPPPSSTPSVPAQSTTPVSPGTSTPVGPAPSSSILSVVTQQQTTTAPSGQPSGSPTSFSSSSVTDGFSSPTTSSATTTTPLSGSPSSLVHATQTETSLVSPSATSQQSGAISLPAGVYVAIGVGSFTVLVLLIAGVCFLRRRRRHPSLTVEVSPFDPGLTSIASEKSQLSRGPYVHVNRPSSTASTVYHSAPPYTPVDDTGSAEVASRASFVDHDTYPVPSEQGERMETATYEPLGSPSTASPLMPGRFNGNHRDTLTSSSISPVSKSRRTRRDTQDLRRRSMDGGVRLAGGPSGTRRDADLADVDARSAVSTLPPLYQSYPAA